VKQNTTAIVLGITGDWAFAAATVLFGLKQHFHNQSYDIIIFHDNMATHDQESLNKIHECHFIQYAIKLINPDKFNRVTKMAFSRFECFGLLEKYENVIWIDSDVLIVGNLDKLVSQNQTGFSMYRHENIPINVSFSSNVDGYNMNADCYNDGIFIINRSLKHPLQLKKWCYEKTEKFFKHINSDQAIINLLLQEFDIEVTSLDLKYNCHPENNFQNPLIFHPWGPGKFWNKFWNPIWDSYYQQWLELKGTPCPEYAKFKRQNLGLRSALKKIKQYFRHA
jgi:lipopolysaccharide biosynthesis glycosyltransferase